MTELKKIALQIRQDVLAMIHRASLAATLLPSRAVAFFFISRGAYYSR